MALLIHLLIMTGIFVILGVSLNIALGYTGLINLGHVAFFGVGAYTSAIAVMSGVPYGAAFVLAGALAAVFGWLLSAITNNMKGDYLALATLGFGFIAHNIFLNWQSVTRGPLGIPGIPRPSMFGWEIAGKDAYLLFVALVAGIAVYLLTRLMRSRYGRLLEAVRDEPMGTEARGKNVFRLKYQSMMISAFFAGIGGSLYAHYVTFIDPSTFYINDIVILLVIVIIGGIASIRGSVVAGFIVIMLPELLRLLNLPDTVVGPMRWILFNAILILILLYRPRGLFGRVDLQ